MDPDNTTYDVSDIQLPPSDTLRPSPHSSSLPVYLQTQYHSYQNLGPYYLPYSTPIPVRPQYFYPRAPYLQTPGTPFLQPSAIPFLQPPVSAPRPSVSQIISSIKARAESSVQRPAVPSLGTKRVSRFLSGPPPEAAIQPDLLTTKKKCKKKLKKNRASLAAEIEKMKASQQSIPDHDTRLLVVPKSAEWTAQHQDRVLRISQQLEAPGDPCEAADETRLIVGTCVSLEKDYYRITSNIDPSKVRPERILRKSLELVKEVWDDEGDYPYVSDQLKSIRQDLTVQGIRNDFSVSVYDAHARISLLAGDHSEFGQCLTQLRQLSEVVDLSPSLRSEITCYHILNCMFTQHYAGVMEAVGLLEGPPGEFVSSALAIQKAHETCNYRVFFHAYKSFPGLGKYIIDWFVDRFRSRVLSVLFHSFRPAVTVDLIADQLGFDGSDECLSFLTERGVVVVGGVVDCKQMSSLFI